MIKKLKTIEFFKEISNIPRESGHEEKIAEYLCQFAEKRNLFYKKDQYNNVLIKKKTCEIPPIILQAHTDMICEKDENKRICFDIDKIEVIEENGYLKANGTTLGADNGIGVAQILAILDSDLQCNIEAVFTVSEETSMIGAIHFDTKLLNGKTLLNLDGFEENTIIVESACFYDIILKTNYSFRENKIARFYKVNLIGMPGGHSGAEINNNRGNSSIELATLLSELKNIQLFQFVSGTKFNVIPSSALAIFASDENLEELSRICKQYERKLQLQFPNAKIMLQQETDLQFTLSLEQTNHFLENIIRFPNGVTFKNSKNEVTTSVNLGVVNLQKQEWKVGMRSSKKEQEKNVLKMLQNYCKENQLEFSILSSQPGFESEENSNLIKSLLKTHPLDLFNGQNPQLKSMHITVEVGFFKEKIPELEIAIISPNIQGAHTTKECVEIASVERLDTWLWNFLNETN